MRERSLPKTVKVWLPHGLDAAVLQTLVTRLSQIEGLRQAYLVRKRVTYRPDVPLYVLGFDATSLGFTGNARTLAVMQQLRDQVQFPGETLIINVDGADERFGREFRAMAGSRIL